MIIDLLQLDLKLTMTDLHVSLIYLHDVYVGDENFVIVSKVDPIELLITYFESQIAIAFIAS